MHELNHLCKHKGIISWEILAHELVQVQRVTAIKTVANAKFTQRDFHWALMRSVEDVWVCISVHSGQRQFATFPKRIAPVFT